MYFLLNQDSAPVAIGDIDPNTTVLQFVRERGLVGTKEGCASGDCGACTCVVGELTVNDADLQVHYQSINSCIALACGLAGKHLVTVEGLQEKGILHPVQQAMVTEHGSQCGFCTPGFVMSLFALYQNCEAVELADIECALSGNLCRCTGYQPIIKAAFSAFETKQHHVDYYQRCATEISQQLMDLSPNKSLNHVYQTSAQSHYYHRPSNLDELAQLYSEFPEAKLIAGGSDLSLEITQQLHRFKRIIALKNVQELKVVDLRDHELEIYAGVSFEQANQALVTCYPALKEFLARFASKPIRNWASICANIANASPIGDMPPVLIALDARLRLRKGNKTREVMLEDFFIAYRQTLLEPGELIESVIIPRLKNGEMFKAYKLSKRFEDDISAVAMAIKLNLNNNHAQSARIALGGMAAIPKRVQKLEQVLVEFWSDEALGTQALAALKKEVEPLDDVRASAEYRLQVSVALLQRCVLECSGEHSFNVGELAQHLIEDKLYG